MDWGWITIYAFAIFGAAGIAGGIVAFRGSSRSGIRALVAASVASGVLMWIVVLMVVCGMIEPTPMVGAFIMVQDVFLVHFFFACGHGGSEAIWY